MRRRNQNGQQQGGTYATGVDPHTQCRQMIHDLQATVHMIGKLPCQHDGLLTESEKPSEPCGYCAPCAARQAIVKGADHGAAKSLVMFTDELARTRWALTDARVSVADQAATIGHLQDLLDHAERAQADADREVAAGSVAVGELITILWPDSAVLEALAAQPDPSAPMTKAELAGAIGPSFKTGDVGNLVADGLLLQVKSKPAHTFRLTDAQLVLHRLGEAEPAPELEDAEPDLMAMAPADVGVDGDALDQVQAELAKVTATLDDIDPTPAPLAGVAATTISFVNDQTGEPEAVEL